MYSDNIKCEVCKATGVRGSFVHEPDCIAVRDVLPSIEKVVPVAAPAMLKEDTHVAAHKLISMAAELVGGNRQKTHGDKLHNHQNIADLWTAFLGVKINPLQVALMMVLLKVARTKTGSLNIDDFVDAAGYAGVAGDIAQMRPVWEEKP